LSGVSATLRRRPNCAAADRWYHNYHTTFTTEWRAYRRRTKWCTMTVASSTSQTQGQRHRARARTMPPLLPHPCPSCGRTSKVSIALARGEEGFDTPARHACMASRGIRAKGEGEGGQNVWRGMCQGGGLVSGGRLTGTCNVPACIAMHASMRRAHAPGSPPTSNGTHRWRRPVAGQRSQPHGAGAPEEKSVERMKTTMQQRYSVSEWPMQRWECSRYCCTGPGSTCTSCTPWRALTSSAHGSCFA
jgi:hypothetical protein